MSTGTIFALATAPGRAGLAVIRISGPEAAAALMRLGGVVPPPRRLHRVSIGDGCGETLDDGLMVYFPGPASFSGEDVGELHLHGSRAVVKGVLAALGRCTGLRPAEPGEFARRAFANGKLDLTAVEGLADLIEAETSAQRRQALRQMGGGLANLYDGWRAQLVDAQAHIEAAIDFADEDIPEDLEAGVRRTAAQIAAAIGRHLDDGRRGERLRDGMTIAIVGPPNAGKSSLLNALAGRAAAIVSPHPGTTRDVIEVALDLGGYPVVLADTAGLRDGADAVEREGVERARQQAAAADLRLVVLDGALWPMVTMPPLGPAADGEDLLVVNKADLFAAEAPGQSLDIGGRTALPVSTFTGAGLAMLLDAIVARCAVLCTAGIGPPLTRERHRHALAACREALLRLETAYTPEVLAEDLRHAAAALGRITGRIEVEEVLDRIFQKFCIGK